MRWLTWRRGLLLALALLIVGIAIAAHHYSRPQRVSAILVDQLQSRYGLTLAMPQPASVDFLPSLRVQLEQPVLNANAAGAPIVSAERIELRVPWSTLYGSQPDIELVELSQPRIDLDALQTWLATQAAGSGATVVPAFRLSASDASLIRGGQVLASGLNVQLAHAGELGAWIDQWSTGAGPAAPIPPVIGSLDAATIQIDQTRLDGVKLRIDEAAPAAPPKP